MNATGLNVAQQVHHLLADLPEIGTVADGELREELLNCEQATQMLMARQAIAMAEMVVVPNTPTASTSSARVGGCGRVRVEARSSQTRSRSPSSAPRELRPVATP